MQWHVVNTHFEEMKSHHNQKDGSKNTQIGPVLEVATCYLHGKYGVEIRIESVNKDNSHSWVRVSHGSNKFVMNLSNIEQETSEMQFEECALRLNAGDFANRSNAKAKPERRELAGSSSGTIPMNQRNWIDIEPGKLSLCARSFEESNSSSSSWTTSA